MRVFVSGASCALGSRLVPQLIDERHAGWRRGFPAVYSEIRVANAEFKSGGRLDQSGWKELSR